jgi:microcin C transport system permease protein
MSAQLTEWAARGFRKDLTAADGISYVDPETGTVYAVYSGNNIRFPFPPTSRHIFGLDGSGRDVFSRIVYATRIAMSFGLLLAVTATILGMTIGSIQGYFGGKVDICVQRFTEIWAAMPFLYIMVLVGAVFGRSFWLLLLVYGLFCWLGLSYYMRAEFLRLRNRPFVAAARCQGLTNARIIFRHILPNALTPIITLFPFLLVGAIGSLVSLDFLGFGLPPLTPSWGELLNQAQTYRWAWWLILFPSLAIFTVMFLTVMVGEGVRNAFDPKPFSKLQ